MHPLGVPGGCVFRCWDLTLKNGEGMGWEMGSGGFTGVRKSGFFTRVCLVPEGWTQRAERPPQVLCSRAEYKTGNQNARQGKSEHLKIVYVFPCSAASPAGLAGVFPGNARQS